LDKEGWLAAKAEEEAKTKSSFFFLFSFFSSCYPHFHSLLLLLSLCHYPHLNWFAVNCTLYYYEKEKKKEKEKRKEKRQ
jgi:hypothetical protein